MTRSGLSLAVAVGAICALTSWPSQSAAERLEELTESWYTIEAIVFQRAAAARANSGERLGRTGERSFPARLQSISAGVTGGYGLSPFALATLEFPTVSYDCIAAGEAAPYRPGGVPARYRPQTPHTADVSGAAGNDPSTAPPDDRIGEDGPGRVCGPPGPEMEDAGTAPATICPPAPFDVPLAPGESPPPCAVPPGRVPPLIEPRLAPHPLLDWLDTARRFENRLRTGSYQAGMDGAMLRREARRIDNAGGLHLLWRGRWTQPVPPRGAAEPLLVQAGRRGETVHELEGTFDITLGRYLHFRARLWFRSPPVSRTVAGFDPESPRSADPGTGEENNAPAAGGPTPYMVLEESRVMRSGTLHYLDHPVLGVLVRADPVAAPRWSAAFDSAELHD